VFSPFRSVGLTAAILLACPLVFTAQQPATSPRPQPQFRAGTNLVRVDVFATRGGTPVQDLTAADFDLFEDGAHQKIESFEHIVVEPAGPDATRVEPNSVTESRQLIEDPHRRVFVVFLDTGNVTVGGSHNIRQPLIDLLTRVIGPDDLFGVMTPDMNPMQITFARRGDVVAEQLEKHWNWGRSSSLQMDDTDKLYEQCWPSRPGDQSRLSPTAAALITRRREQVVMDSLEELVRYMGTAREGRTAVVTVTPGWALYTPDQSLTALQTDPSGRQEPVPGMPPIGGLGPNGGLTTATKDNSYGGLKYQCDRDRMELAMIDDQQRFRDIMGEANRADVSFYPVDPRGMPVFDTEIGPDATPDTIMDLQGDRKMLLQRADSLQTLAANTDGIALINNNDLGKQMRRVSDDLTSYYLLGYYSTNTKLDGKYRQIKVVSKRSGIDLRARRGYRAATQEEVDKARAAANAPVPEAKAALTRALGSLEGDAHGAPSRRTTRDEPLVFHRGPTTGNKVEPAAGHIFSRSDRLHVELEAPAPGITWSGVLLDRTGKQTPIPVTTGERTDAASGQRWLTADITLAPLGAGDYVISLTTTEPNQNAQRLVAIRVTN
jgi:VWFA-related protein